MTSTATQGDASGPPATATLLLDMAERLFAEHGIEAVSMRQIVLASGQGNLSAAHYHFGSRDVLIRKLLERRMEVVDAMRHARLDRLVAQTARPDIRALLGASIATLADVVQDHPWGADYVQVIAQALFNPRMRLLESIDPRAISGLTRMIEMARRLLADLPRAVFDSRMTLIQHETVYTFSRWLHAHGPLTAKNRSGFLAMVAEVTEFMSAGLNAAAPAPASSSASSSTRNGPQRRARTG